MYAFMVVKCGSGDVVGRVKILIQYATCIIVFIMHIIIIMFYSSESFKELSQIYKAKALERAKPKKERESPQMMMVCYACV